MIFAVTVVVVTYADRFHLLKQVLDACLDIGVTSIIVVDNDSNEKSKKQLIHYSHTQSEHINVIWNSANLGSAKGYQQGLKAAQKENSDFIWLLDDDNRPRPSSLKKLVDFWKVKPDHVEALLSFRPDRPQYKQAIQENNSDLVLSLKNSFLGFHLKEKLLKIFKPKDRNDVKFGQVAYAPYGGMFFKKSTLEEIGYPNERFFLYSDDHDWSYRITMMGKKIFLILESVIDDIDTSWAVKDKKSTVFKRIKEAASFRVYYTTRNRMLFEKKYLVTNGVVYRMNRYIYTFILSLYAYNAPTYKVFFKAMRDADNDNLENFK